MLLKCYNRALIQDVERTYLTAACAAASTSITVVATDLAPAGTSSTTWSDNDYMIIGEIGQEGTEIMQVAAAVTSATSITIDREGSAGGTRYAHPAGTPIYRVDFNQVEFSHATTDSTSSVSVLATLRLQPDDEFTKYDDQSNSTGYGFVRFKNETSSAYSSYSDGVNYEVSGEKSSRDPRTLWSMRNKVRQLLDELDSTKLSDEMVDNAINDKQREIAHMRLWSFYEGERSFSAVADQFAYDIPSTVQKVHGVRFDTQPLVYINKANWDIKHWDSDTSVAKPYNFCVWDRQLLLEPRPSTAAASTTLGADISTATATSITVASTASFNRGDYYRIIVNSEVIYATASTSTTFTGCLRGQEGTTATTHTNGDTVTERDIVYTAHVEPTDLIDTQDRTEIPEPDVLVYGVVMDLAPLVNKQELIALYESKYNARIKMLEDKYSVKQTAQFGRIKDASERMQDFSYKSDPNRYPTSINT